MHQWTWNLQAVWSNNPSLSSSCSSKLLLNRNLKFCALFSAQQKSWKFWFALFTLFSILALRSFFSSSSLSPALDPPPGGFGALGVEKIPEWCHNTAQHSTVRAAGHRQYISRDCWTKAISIGIPPVGSPTIAGESCFGESRAQEDPAGVSSIWTHVTRPTMGNEMRSVLWKQGFEMFYWGANHIWIKEGPVEMAIVHCSFVVKYKS